MPFQAVRAIYFDLDDTLCGYWDASKAAMRQTFEELAPQGQTAESMLQAWAAAFRKFSRDLKHSSWYAVYLKNGEPTRTEQMRLALLEIGIDDPVLARQLSDRYGELRDKNLNLFGEALSVLDTLKGRYPLGLITNGPADIQRQEIATLGIGDYFPHVFIEGELEVGKPEPIVYERAFASMAAELPGLKPEEVLMVGNSYGHDILGAHHAGWVTAWIRRPSDVSPSSTRPEERPEGSPEPTLVITDLREILTALGLEEVF